MYTFFQILITSALLTLTGCHQDSSPTSLDPSGDVTGVSSCKNAGYSEFYDSSESYYECIEYRYASGNVLLLKHINPVFNCCISEITADIEIGDDVITITEYENFDPDWGPCYCECLFDVDFALEGIPVTRYFLRIRSSYFDSIETWIDLRTEPSGIFCVERH